MNLKESQHDGLIHWRTPPEILEALGPFDIDGADWQSWDGLTKPWAGCVFLNPPYQRKLIGPFMKRMADHCNGVALVFVRSDATWFQDYVLAAADAILFVRGRIVFVAPDGSRPDRPPVPSCLVGYGAKSVAKLQDCGLQGRLVHISHA